MRNLKELCISAKEAFTVEKIKEHTKTSVKKMLSPKNIIINLYDCLLVALALLSLFGEHIIGFNLPVKYFIYAISVYLTYALYKSILRIMDLIDQTKSGMVPNKTKSGKSKR